MKYAVYASIQKASKSSPDLEMRAISYITLQLADASRPEADPMTRIRALNGNIRLWSMLIEDLSDPANALPPHSKANYVSLGLFVHRASLAALTSPADLSILISINSDMLDALNYQRQASIAA